MTAIDNLDDGLLVAHGELDASVIDLARVAAVATLVEPALLRRLRLKVLPALDAGVEADLWFSSLVHVASASSMTLQPQVAHWLRSQLSEPGYAAMAAAARGVVSAAHRGHSDMVQLEETIVWATIRQDVQAVHDGLGRALETMAVGSEEALAVARWVAQARRRLPRSALESERGQQLLTAASLRLHRRIPREILDRGQFPPSTAGAVAINLPLVDVGVRILTGGLRFSAPAQPGDGVLSVPETTPLVVEVSWSDADGERRTDLARVEQGVFHGEGLDPDRPDVEPVQLRTIDGARYRLSSSELRVVTVAVMDMAVRELRLLESANESFLADAGATIRVVENADLYDRPEVLVLAPAWSSRSTHLLADLIGVARRASTSRPGTVVQSLAGSPLSEFQESLLAEAAGVLNVIRADGVLETVEQGRRAVAELGERPPSLYRVEVGSAINVLQAVALAFHVRATHRDEVQGRDAETRLFDLTDEPARTRFWHVQGMCEWIFSGPVRDYLAGGPDPFHPPAPTINEESMAIEAAAPDDPFPFPGMADLGLSWSSFAAYLGWVCSELERYVRLIAQRLPPRLLEVAFGVTGGDLDAVRLALGTAILRPSELNTGWALGERILVHVPGHPMVGADVLELQQVLLGLHFDAGPVDGTFGPSTENALREFQRSVGLPATGFTGSATSLALSQSLTRGPGAPSMGRQTPSVLFSVERRELPTLVAALAEPILAAVAARDRGSPDRTDKAVLDDIERGDAARDAGRYDDARERYERARSLLDQRRDRDPDDDQWARPYVSVLTRLAALEELLGEQEKVVELLLQALAIYRGLGDRPGEANALSNLGDAYIALGRTREALELYEPAEARARSLVAGSEPSGPAADELAELLLRKADLAERTGNRSTALLAVEEAVATRRRLVAASPNNVTWAVALADTLVQFSDLHPGSDSPLSYLLEARSLAAQLVQVQPSDPTYQELLRDIEDRIGDLAGDRYSRNSSSLAQPEGTKVRVLLSYVPADRRFATNLGRQLKNSAVGRSVTVLEELDAFRPDTQWTTAALDLVGRAEIAVVIVSATWGLAQWSSTDQQLIQQRHSVRQLRILPVWLDGVLPGPGGLETLAGIDVTRLPGGSKDPSAAYREITAAIARIVSELRPDPDEPPEMYSAATEA